MARRLNRRGWYVLVSIAADDGAACVDFFETPTGDFGYQHFRSNSDDQGWTPIGNPDAGYKTVPEAAARAVVAIGWLTAHPRAQRSFEDWLRLASP